MSELGYWTKTRKIDKGFLGTALAAAINTKSKVKQKKFSFIGILTVTDRISNGLSLDKVGQKIQNSINQTNRFQAIIKVNKIASSDTKEVISTLKHWSDNLGLDIVFTIGSSGIEPTAIVPEATRQVVEKEIPGMLICMLISGLKFDPSSIFFRGICGIRKSTLIVNLPENVEKAVNCFSVLLPYLPAAIDNLNTQNVSTQQNIYHSFASSEVPQAANAVPRLETPVYDTTSPHHRLPNPVNHHLQTSVPNIFQSNTHTIESTNHVPIRMNHFSQRLPSHHQVERDHVVEESGSTEEASGQLTEEEILGGESLNDMITLESLHVVGEFPSHFIAGIEDSAFASEGSTDIDFSKIARRPRTSPYPEVSVDKASSTIYAVTNPMPAVEKPINEAIDHILANDVFATSPVPPADTAILDGYAVKAANTPGDLRVVSSKDDFAENTALRIQTGDVMPLGSDSVIPVEETTVQLEADEGRAEANIRCLSNTSPGMHVRTKGRDIGSGDRILKAGTKLGHLEIAMLASLAVFRVRVHKYPVVAIISYGKSLRDVTETNLHFNEIRDTNRLMYKTALEQQGYPVVDMGIVNGGAKQLKEIVKQACEKADVIITTGGAAVGENDIVKPVLVEMGAVLHFGRVAAKPGSPSAFATLASNTGKKFFFVLAGVPVPSYVGYLLFVLPCLRRLRGCTDPRTAVVKTRVSTDIRLDLVPEYKRVSLRYESQNSLPWADVTGDQSVSRLLSLVSADALLVLPPRSAGKQTLKRGEVVVALLIK